MKKFITTTALLLSIAMLAACAENAENPNSTPTNSVSDNNSDNSTSTDEDSASESKTDSDSEAENEPTLEELIDAFALDNVTMPDGSTVSKTEAVDALGDYMIGFDFAYLRYPKPIFESTLQNPDLINWDTLEWNTDFSNTLENTEYIIVKAGDVLENGLVVESARLYVDISGSITANQVTLNGEITAEGIIEHFPEDDIYITQGDVRFCIDPTKGSTLPVLYNLMSDMIWPTVNTEEQFALFYDGDILHLGNINDMSVDISDYFRESNYVRAKITIKNIQISHSEMGGLSGIIAEPVSVEIIE